MILLISNNNKQKAIKNALEKKGHKVICASKNISPQLIYKTPVDLVITDNPNMSCATTPADLRKIAPNLKIIALDNNAERRPDQNVSEWLPYSCTNEELTDKVEQLLSIDPLYHFYFYTKE